MKNATVAFLCAECDHTISFSQDIMIGDNTADFTCKSCGEQWHVLFEVTSLEPLHVGTALTKRTVGYLVGDRFVSKGMMQ
jgi:transcription elongation factor Elf1